MGYESEDGIVVTKACTIDSSVVTCSFTPTETSTMLGIYKIKIKAKDSSDEVALIFESNMEVKESLMADF